MIAQNLTDGKSYMLYYTTLLISENEHWNSATAAESSLLDLGRKSYCLLNVLNIRSKKTYTCKIMPLYGSKS